MARHRAEWGTPYPESTVSVNKKCGTITLAQETTSLTSFPLPSPSVYRVDAWWGMAEGMTSWYLTVWLSVYFYGYECSHTMCMQCPQKPEGTGCPSIRVTDGFKFPCGCGEEDQVLWKCSHCSQPLSHHSSPKLIPLKKHFQVPKIKTAKVSGLWGALRQMRA